jgi:hypothetical protein
MASTIPPPHIPFASGSSYLPDALVPMPLPFHFLFPGLVLMRRSFLFVFGVLCAPVWVFRLLAFHNPPPGASLLHAPRRVILPSATLLSGVLARSRLPIDHSAFYFMFFWFPYILFPLFIFCFDFPLYFVLLGFLVFALLFPCIAFFCLFCMFFDFYSFADLLRVWSCHTPSTVKAFFRAPTTSSFQRVLQYTGLLARDRFYFPVFLLFLLVISPVSNSLLWGCDAWSRSLGCGCEHYPGFRVKEDKCWPRGS